MNEYKDGKIECKADEPLWIRIIESLLPGRNLRYRRWKTLNCKEVGVERTKKNLVRWKIEETTECKCRDPRRTRRPTPIAIRFD